MLEEITVPIHPAPLRFAKLLLGIGFKLTKAATRVEFHQWHRDVGSPIEYFADVYANDNWAELYTRPRNGKHITERFSGLAETELDFGRLLWQCGFINAQEWANCQKLYATAPAPKLGATADESIERVAESFGTIFKRNKPTQ